MMRPIVVCALLSGLAGPLSAQGGAPDRLREQVVMRFMQNYRVQAGLGDEQFARFQAVMRQSWEARRTSQVRQRSLLRELEGQLRPGIAADADSVGQLIDQLLDVRAAEVERAREEQRAYAEFLSPVQRGQLMLAMARLEQQIEGIVRRRMPGPRRN